MKVLAIEPSISPVVKTNSTTKNSLEVAGKNMTRATKATYSANEEKAKARKDPRILQTLLLGVPSPASSLWSYITAAINLLLVIFIGDLVFRAPLLYSSHDLSFARVGYVFDTSANILLCKRTRLRLATHLHLLPKCSETRRSTTGRFMEVC